MTGHLAFVETYFKRAEKREAHSKLVRLVLAAMDDSGAELENFVPTTVRLLCGPLLSVQCACIKSFSISGIELLE
jgi:hypothetical protein